MRPRERGLPAGQAEVGVGAPRIRPSTTLRWPACPCAGGAADDTVYLPPPHAVLYSEPRPFPPVSVAWKEKKAMGGYRGTSPLPKCPQGSGRALLTAYLPGCEPLPLIEESGSHHHGRHLPLAPPANKSSAASGPSPVLGWSLRRLPQWLKQLWWSKLLVVRTYSGSQQSSLPPSCQ